jgi:hypothetical protein
VENSEADKSLSYYASNRASAILSNNKEIGRVFAECLPSIKISWS